MSTLVQLSPAEMAEDRGYILHILAIAVPIIATLAVLLRLLARGRTKASFAVDDWFILGSLAPLYGMSACTWMSA